jgi:hypothetical protein
LGPSKLHDFSRPVVGILHTDKGGHNNDGFELLSNLLPSPPVFFHNYYTLNFTEVVAGLNKK